MNDFHQRPISINVVDQVLFYHNDKSSLFQRKTDTKLTTKTTYYTHHMKTKNQTSEL